MNQIHITNNDHIDLTKQIRKGTELINQMEENIKNEIPAGKCALVVSGDAL